MGEQTKPIELHREFISFAGVGVVGFFVDGAIFLLLSGGYGWSIGAARTLSATGSIVTTWALNRRLTFAARRSRLWSTELALYALGQAAGLVVNIGSFIVTLWLAPALRSAPIFALALGAAAALLFNFITARTLAFRPRAP
jgi:putative flippase GtrA